MNLNEQSEQFSFKEAIRNLWEEKPLVLIVFAAILIRLVAVIFSKGFAFHDDEFLVLDPAGSWVDGYDYNSWLGGRAEMNHAPEGPSLFFPGIHYFILKYLKWRGVMDPQHRMYVIRGIMAAWSLITVVVGYKIAEFYGGKKVGRQAGLLLAILWFMPMLSVRDLVEMFCIPPLMLATWFAINPKRKDRLMTYFWIGIFCGIAFNTRFQTAMFTGGLGLVVMFRKNEKTLMNRIMQVFLFGLMFLATVVAVQGLVDMIIWGRPFAEFTAYIQYNIDNSRGYPNGPWYNYFLVLGGILVPPISLLLLFGYFRSWKKYTILFLPAFCFFAFHSIFPNKQERFILPMVPFVVVLGCIGWNEFLSTSKYWQKHPGLLKGFWTFFWILNLIALPVVSTMYTKKSRVESMYYLYQQKDLRNFMVEESNRGDVTQAPMFYAGNWYFHPREISSQHTLLQDYLYLRTVPDSLYHPNYVLFFGKEKKDERIAAFKNFYPNAAYQTTIEPSYLDILIWKLNPVNRNETVYIYKFDDKVVNLPDSVKRM